MPSQLDWLLNPQFLTYFGRTIQSSLWQVYILKYEFSSYKTIPNVFMLNQISYLPMKWAPKMLETTKIDV